MVYVFFFLYCSIYAAPSFHRANYWYSVALDHSVPNTGVRYKRHHQFPVNDVRYYHGEFHFYCLNCSIYICPFDVLDSVYSFVIPTAQNSKKCFQSSMMWNLLIHGQTPGHAMFIVIALHFHQNLYLRIQSSDRSRQSEQIFTRNLNNNNYKCGKN